MTGEFGFGNLAGAIESRQFFDDGRCRSIGIEFQCQRFNLRAEILRNRQCLALGFSRFEKLLTRR